MNWTDARGSTSVLAAFALLGVAGVTVAAVEMSRTAAAETALQDLADSTALRTARAHSLEEQAAEALASEAEATVLSQMAQQNPGATDPTADVAFAEDRDAVTVRLSQKVGMFGTVSAEATAVEEAPALVCLLVLEPEDAGAWSITGNATVTARDCAAQVNSASARALSGGGAARVEMLRTLVVGPGTPVRGFEPAPRYGQPVVADPYADKLPWPNPTTCNQTNLVLKKGATTLQPGVYCGGLELGSHATADLAPGVYVLKNGPLKIASHAVLNAGSGVTFVMVGDGGFVESRAGASMRLKAPTTGPWAGFVVAQPAGGKERQSSVVIGGGDVSVDGMFYLPSQRMMLSGGGAGALGAMVVKTLDMRGNGRLKLSPTPIAPILPGYPKLEEPPPPPPDDGGPG